MIGLGLDTGGTYTDAVLIDRATNIPLARAKSPTTHHDLSIGIKGALLGLPQELLQRAELASLSTTLATNACVEGKGGRAAVLLLGYNEKLVSRLAAEYGLPAEDLHILPGAHTQQGEPAQKPDYNRLRQLAMGLAPRLDAIGVAEYWGVRNPEYEMRAKQILQEVTGLPVAAAHELSGDINSLRRAATTLLNARLIPLTAELLRAVRRTFTELDITAPLLIVRGDGALMSEEYALSHPVETLLSGPAASVAGAAALGGQGDCLAVDIGGTTTDIAVVRNGRTELSDTGVQVGAFRTGTRAVQVRTIGLGGDTRLFINGEDALCLDTRRAMPLCALASQHPAIVADLHDMLLAPRRLSYSRAEFLLYIRKPSALLTQEESALLDALKDGPLPIEKAAQSIGTRPYFLRTERLEQWGAVQRCALTLTDLWHVMGDFAAFDKEAALLGTQILAARLEISTDALLRQADELAQNRLFSLLAGHLIERAQPRAKPQEALRLGFAPFSDEIGLSIRCHLPIVGIGAPADRLLPGAADLLQAQYIAPDYAGVGGAVGAITGPILKEARVLIRPLHTAWGVEGFACHAPDGMEKFDTYEEAIAWSRDTAQKAAHAQAAAMGAQDIVCEIKERQSVGYSAGADAAAMLLETGVTAIASGRA